MFITIVIKCYCTCDLYYICDQLLHLCLKSSVAGMLTGCFDTKVVLKQVVDSVKVKIVVWFIKQEILVHAKHFLYFMSSKLFFKTTEQFLAR